MRTENILRRTERLRKAFPSLAIDGVVLFVFESANWQSVYYISGFRGSSAGVLITEQETCLITDGRYMTQASEQSPFTLIPQGQRSLVEAMGDLLKQKDCRRVGLEKEKVSAKTFEQIQGLVRDVEWKDASQLLPMLRRAKDSDEADLIKRAGMIASNAYRTVIAQVKEGMTEKEFDALLEYTVKKLGAEGGWGNHGFIVASGPRSALPHGVPTDRSFQKGDWVTVDFGAMVGGYLSDITRNFCLGKPDTRAREIEMVLLNAHKEAAIALKPGVSGKEIDGIARRIIADGGYGEYFTHGLGHGLGLEIHENPRLSPLSEDFLQVGDVTTVEPGIYIPGFGGMRIEDDYLITESGAERLSGNLEQGLLLL